ncbi:MAG TPA: hypothetical protein VKB86_13155 [Pyrinomonadaceae bacterium]|nr:hypothetical protein [Pyrinomonadaceae bacterium]
MSTHPSVAIKVPLCGGLRLEGALKLLAYSAVLTKFVQENYLHDFGEYMEFRYFARVLLSYRITP